MERPDRVCRDALLRGRVADAGRVAVLTAGLRKILFRGVDNAAGVCYSIYVWVAFRFYEIVTFAGAGRTGVLAAVGRNLRQQAVDKGTFIMKNFGRIRTIIAAGAMAAALACAAPAASFTALAATGTVTGDDINVRSEASTSGSIVDTVSTGDTVTVGESAEDDSGATWYYVTLSDGTTGYIRSDFLTVTEDDEETSSEETSSEETSGDDTTDSAVTDATEEADSDTGGYQIVLAPDEDGNNTYYLYDNNAGERMKISDISLLQEEVNEANQEAADVKNTYTMYLIVLVVAVVILLIVCIVLALKLRDAVANGPRERDLTRDRANERRNGGRSADSVDALRAKRGTQSSRSGRGAEDPYASGTRRNGRESAGPSYRQEGEGRRTSSARESDAYSQTRTRSTSSGSSRPARESDVRTASSRAQQEGRSGSSERRSYSRTGDEASSERRSSSRTGDEASSERRSYSRTGEEASSERRSSSRSADASAERRSSSRAGDEQSSERRSSSRMSEEASAERRSTSPASGEGRRSSSSASGEGRRSSSSASGESRSSSGQASSSRARQSRSYADEEFDYEFLQLDDDQ